MGNPPRIGDLGEFKKFTNNADSDQKASSKKKLSLYDALRSRAELVKTENAVSKSAALLSSLGEIPTTSKTEEMKSVDFSVFSVGNSLEEFPVSFHPEEELARKG